ncbi:hypothetical protein CARUB_v10011186mg [Capsella rubella]|uniref:F-box domain-containing protein n=1 Tax=Capsella rubella TaxID=81985 RepID=R0INV5_9BRAS|nr:hypothetical protein CARUB_v10011186mg [Capsella rubella]
MDRRKIVRGHTEKLPNDLIIEVLSRVPAKSVAICRCVSKQWDSLLVSQVFKESFLSISLSRPRLLFNFSFRSKWHFFSSPQPQKFGDNFSIVANEHHMGSYEYCYIQSCQSVHGFIYLRYGSRRTNIYETTHVIYNPCTRQHLTLPKLEIKSIDLQSFLTYDPIQKQFKVLCMTVVFRPPGSIYRVNYKVLTLGTGELLWRDVECSFPHHPMSEMNGICINGVLYCYIAYGNGTNASEIVCFDVSSEKFSFIKIDKDRFVKNLINYKGKLGVLVCFNYSLRYYNEVWILDDTNEVKWSKHMFVLPIQVVKSMRATDTGEIAWTTPSYVFYYNMESRNGRQGNYKRVRRVEIKGMEDKVTTGKDRHEFHTSMNHVENLMFLYKETGCSDQSIGEDMRDNLGTERGDEAAC